MKVAIVHDWLMVVGGAEKTLEQIVKIFSSSDIFAVIDFLPSEYRSIIDFKQVKTSFIQKLPFVKSHYRHYLPLMPIAVEQLDLRDYDLVISCSHSVAKGVITAPEQPHLCYCFSPMRYAWDLQFQYLSETQLDRGAKGWLTRVLLHRMRSWDQLTANRVDDFMAISKFIAARIYKCYRRESRVVYPPVDVERFSLQEEKQDYYMTASRMVPYKKIDVIVEAFTQMPDKKLVVIGDGPDFKKIQQKASKNISLLGYQDFNQLKKCMQNAKAFLFAAKEDFGIVPIEAQACGTPVIGLEAGALKETIRGIEGPDPTGVFFDEQSVSSIVKAVKIFEENQIKISPLNCRLNALRFSTEIFQSEFKKFVYEKVKSCPLQSA